MGQIAKNPEKSTPLAGYKADSTSGTAIQAASGKKKINLLPWVVGVIFIFSMLNCSSYLALLWLPPYERMDMKSQLTADYGPWTFMVFQPVDPAIIEEVKQERGLSGQIVIDRESWSTPVLSAPSTLPANSETSATPQPTNGDPSFSPTAFETTLTSTPIPTSVISLPEFTVTPQPQPTEAVSRPQSGKPPKTPRPRKTPKPHKTPKSK